MLQHQLKADFQYCENMIKKHSKSFYYAFSGLPAEKSYAVYAIYAFCRIADDSVDENHTTAAKKTALKQLRNELDSFSRQEEPDYPLWRALRHVFNTFEMDIQPFYDQLIGQEMDIYFSSPKTLQELEQYSYYVAGSVGLMLLPIIASEKQQELRQAAIDLGVAMQITNILRDIGEDYYEKNRIYLPVTEQLRFGYGEEKLVDGIIDDSFITLWEHLAIRAENLYNAFTEHLAKFDNDSRLPVAASANVYRGILDVIRENNYDCLSKRNFVAQERLEQIRA
ncbi:phytoene/squalene synthase family protein [Fredinandcohnia sp. QZ13]|uniref:phytoene/squalene synthase family protein n=1 Tax=Fredinandcohnia sp. QZ13 TaxID=3073144 RepID=UPI002853711A|nr:phytoene/squalene synthase family protein [Fredinandcohnia sp. QZ13]MDR4890456.1 phytoene/squalene synthase family protein [Fredinandcohnia sp. QZ13]